MNVKDETKTVTNPIKRLLSDLPKPHVWLTDNPPRTEDVEGEEVGAEVEGEAEGEEEGDHDGALFRLFG